MKRKSTKSLVLLFLFIAGTSSIISKVSYAEDPVKQPAQKPTPDARVGIALFKKPDGQLWKPYVQKDRVVFAVTQRVYGFCEMTLYRTVPIKGDFRPAFKAAVSRRLEEQRIRFIAEDSGITLGKSYKDGYLIATQTITVEDNEGVHWFVGAVSKGQMVMYAFDVSSAELWEKHRFEAQRFVNSLQFVNVLKTSQIPAALRKESYSFKAPVKTKAAGKIKSATKP